MERRQDVVEAQHGARPLLVLCGDLNSCVSSCVTRFHVGVRVDE